MARWHTVLVAEDDPDVRDLLVELLSQVGHGVLAAADGYEAVSILSERHVDLLLTDIRMPGIDGFQLARQAKLIRPALHVLYISGYYAEASAAAGPVYGALLTKPLQVEDLISEVNRELGA
jgi:CheY-like chemotaxis protein